MSFYRLDLAVVLWMMCSALAPRPLVEVRNSAIVLSTAVLAVLVLRWAFDRVSRGDWSLPRSRLTVPLLMVAATAVASGLFGGLLYDHTVPGVHRWVLVEIYATALVVLSIATVFLIGEAIRSRRVLIAALWALFATGMTVAIAAMPPHRIIDLPRWYPIIITYAFTLTYAGVLCGLPKWKWQWGASAVAIGVFLHGPAINFFLHDNQWVSGWLMIGVPLLLLPVLVYPRAALVAIVIGAVGSSYWMWPLVEKAYTLAWLEGDFGRLRIWHDALLMGSLRPLLGVGLGNYIDYAERYAQVDIALSSAHGNYQQIVAEMGVTGIGFVLWVLARAFALAWRLYRTASDRLYRTIGLAILGGLAGQTTAAVLGDYLLPSYHNGGHSNFNTTIYTWMWIGVLMATERLASIDEKY